MTENLTRCKNCNTVLEMTPLYIPDDGAFKLHHVEVRCPGCKSPSKFTREEEESLWMIENVDLDSPHLENGPQFVYVPEEVHDACPFCGQDTLEWTQLDPQEWGAEQSATCTHCGAQFQDTLTLNEREITVAPNKDKLPPVDEGVPLPEEAPVIGSFPPVDDDPIDDTAEILPTDDTVQQPDPEPFLNILLGTHCSADYFTHPYVLLSLDFAEAAELLGYMDICKMLKKRVSALSEMEYEYYRACYISPTLAEDLFGDLDETRFNELDEKNPMLILRTGIHLATSKLLPRPVNYDETDDVMAVDMPAIRVTADEIRLTAYPRKTEDEVFSNTLPRKVLEEFLK